MPQTQTMTLDEKFAIGRKAFELLDAGDREGYSRLTRSIPMPPFGEGCQRENRRGFSYKRRLEFVGSRG